MILTKQLKYPLFIGVAGSILLLSACGGGSGESSGNSAVAASVSEDLNVALPKTDYIRLDTKGDVPVSIRLSGKSFNVEQDDKVSIGSIIGVLPTTNSTTWQNGNCPEYITPGMDKCNLKLVNQSASTILVQIKIADSIDMTVTQGKVTAFNLENVVRSETTGISELSNIKIEGAMALRLRTLSDSVQSVMYKGREYAFSGGVYYVTSNNKALLVSSDALSNLVSIQKISNYPVVFKVTGSGFQVTGQNQSGQAVTFSNLNNNDNVSFYAQIIQDKTGKPAMSLPIYDGSFMVKSNQLEMNV